MVTRLASLTLAASLLTSAGCSMFGGNSGGGGGMFGRSRHAGSTVAGDCCGYDPCATPCAPGCATGGCGVVSHLPPNADGPMLMPPPPPPIVTAPAGSAGVPTAPPPRFAPIPQAAPMPYTP